MRARPRWVSELVALWRSQSLRALRRTPRPGRRR